MVYRSSSYSLDLKLKHMIAVTKAVLLGASRHASTNSLSTHTLSQDLILVCLKVLMTFKIVG